MFECSKCGAAATVHITKSFDGVAAPTTHYCESCGPKTGYEGLTLEQIKALSLKEKTCDFCGSSAISGVRREAGTVHWCRDCGIKRAQLISEFMNTERPDWKRQFTASRADAHLNIPPELTAWVIKVGDRAIEMMKQRHSPPNG